MDYFTYYASLYDYKLACLKKFIKLSKKLKDMK